MKILLTTDTFYPMINGVVISTENLYNQLKLRGHEVKIMTLSHTHEEKLEGDIFYLKSAGASIYPGARVRIPLTGTLVKEIIRWKPDIIHSQTEFSTFFTARMIARKLNITQLHTYHTMYEDYLNYILGGRLIKPKTAAFITKLLLNGMAEVIAPTEKVKVALSSYGVESANHVVATGINIDRFNRDISEKERFELLNSLSLSSQDKILVYIGRLAEEKNIEEVIFNLSSNIKKSKNIKLVIVGGGPYLQNLRAYVKNLNLEDVVRFTGMVKPEEVYKYYKLGSVFVTASTSETQGLTYIEAMASGLPVVCRFDDCIKDVVQNWETGYAYTKTHEFSEAVDRILKNEGLLKELSEKAKLKAEEYSAESFGSKIEGIYLNCYKKREQFKFKKRFLAAASKNKGLAS